MPKLSFYCRTEKDKDGRCYLCMKFRLNGNDYQKPLGYKIKPDKYHWSKSKMEVLEPGSGERVPYNFTEINEMIAWYKKEWITLTNNRDQESITDLEIQDFMNRTKTKIPEKTVPDFWTALDEFYQERTRNKVWRNGTTARHQRSFLKNLKEWGSSTQLQVSFDQVNTVMYEDIKGWCISKGWNDVTRGKFISDLIAFLNWCTKGGREYYDGKGHEDFKRFSREKTHVSLTLEEFFRLLDFPLTNISQIKARDVYCFAVLTGQRITDVMNCQREHIIDGYWYLMQSKETKEVIIPIVPLAREIMDRYQHPIYVMPRVSQAGKNGLNKMIKEACREAGIKSPVNDIKIIAAEARSTIREKWQLVSMHTARKTHATINLNNGIDAKLIKSVTGHKDDAVFDNYARPNTEKIKGKLEEVWKRPEKVIPDDAVTLEPDPEITGELLAGFNLVKYQEGKTVVIHNKLLNISGRGADEAAALKSFRQALREMISKSQ